MNTKLKLLSLALLAGAFLAGCASSSQNGPMTAAIVRASVSTGAIVGIAEDPTVVPYLQAATPVICDAAGQGHVNPADVVAALQSSSVDQLKTPAGVAIINSGIAIYEAVYASYGTNVQTSVVQPYLQGVCLGLRDALPSPLPPPGGVLKLNKPRVLPPHVSMK